MQRRCDPAVLAGTIYGAGRQLTHVVDQLRRHPSPRSRQSPQPLAQITFREMRVELASPCGRTSKSSDYTQVLAVFHLGRFHFQEIQNGVMTNRNTLIPAGSLRFLLEALGNNDLGRIVGFAMRGAFWGARDRTPSHVPRVFLAFVPRRSEIDRGGNQGTFWMRKVSTTSSTA